MGGSKMNNAPGKGMLKVVGILFIIFGGISLLLGILALFGAISGGVINGVEIQTGASAGTILFSAILVIVLAALDLCVGIIGVKNCDKPEKAQTCFVLGVLLIVVVLVSAIINIIGGKFVWYATLIGLVLPVLYLIGALKNKEVSSTGVQGASVIDQAKDAISDAQADIESGAIKDEVKDAATDAVAGAKEISGDVVAKGKEVADKVTKK